MGFFSNLFGKQTCCICGSECGPMSRTKIKNKEFVCDTCARSASLYVRLSEMDKDEVKAHMKFMEDRNRAYEEVLKNQTGGRVATFPSSKIEADAYTCYLDYGVLAIKHKTDVKHKNYTEVIRFDEIDSMEYYEEKNPASEGKPATFKEFGVKFKLVSDKPGASRAKDSINNNPHAHPYIHHEIKLCLTKDEKYAKSLDSILTYLAKSVFGTDDDRSRFFSMSKNEKAQLQAGVDMANLIGSAIKATKDGETDTAAIQEQFEKAQASTERANVGRLADFSRAADELFAKYSAV